MEDLHPSGAKNVSNMCDLFEDDYKEFVLGELTENITSDGKITESAACFVKVNHFLRDKRL